MCLLVLQTTLVPLLGYKIVPRTDSDKGRNSSSSFLCPSLRPCRTPRVTQTHILVISIQFKLIACRYSSSYLGPPAPPLHRSAADLSLTPS
ncbi:hypothetical protein BDW69DRAFT_169591 [Aspergillus filifer]